MKRIISFFLIFLLSFSLISCSDINVGLGDEEKPDNIEENINDEAINDENINDENINDIKEDGYYTGKEEVSLYINTYGKLPNNYINKRQAIDLGWESSKGNLWDVTEKMSIGGDKFGNREKILPIKQGRVYYECDINYEGGYRSSERLVYSNDGLVYYTEDHYESFTLLYGDE